jgi:hypothetical protein
MPILFRRQREFTSQRRIFVFEPGEFFADRGQYFLKFLDGISRGDVLRTVPVESFDVYEDDSFNDVGVVNGTKGFDEGGGFVVVLVDLDAPKDFEACLVGVVHEEESDACVVVEVPQTDVLLVAAQIREADKARVNNTNEAFGTATMLYVGPAGFADRGHVEAVAAPDELLLRGAEGISWRPGLFHSLVLAPAAVFLLVFLDEGSEGQFLKTTTHVVLDPDR